MKKILLFLFILMLPVYSEAAYTIFLKNGSVISDVNSYEEAGEDVNLYFSTGSISVSKKDILKIEGMESQEPEKETVEQQPAEIQERKEQPRDAVSPPVEQTDDREERLKNLQTEIDSLTEQVRAAEKEEARLVTVINEKTSSRFTYNLIQVRQLEMELEPLRQELRDVQQKKQQMIQKRSSLESQFRSQ
jgi:chromosome segregation ATPase